MTNTCDHKPFGENVCGKPAIWLGINKETGKGEAKSCESHSDELASDHPDIEWFPLPPPVTIPTEQELLLANFNQSMDAALLLWEEYRECVDFGMQPPAALMAKIAYHLGRGQESARAFAERYAY